MKSKKEIGEKILEEINEAFESINADQKGKVISVDTKNQTITIQFDYHVVEEDNYIGLVTY